jgi:hypothetical protein
MRPPRAALLLLAAVVAFARAASAQQQVTGTVRDSASRQPVPGAVVTVLDSLGRALERGTTDQRGQFRVAAPAEGRRIRVLRLGFRPRELALSRERGAPGDVVMVAIPILLDQVRVTAAASCPRRDDRASALALLEQVRAGLLSTVVARTENTARMTRLLFQRRFDGSGDRVLEQTIRIDSATLATGPFGAARSAAAFIRDGFMEESGGIRTFFAPDADVLIDDAFATGYCFHVADPAPARPNQIGLGFRAAGRRRGRVDVDGALWIDTTARALVDLEFRYVGLDRDLEARRPGGRIHFRELANGVVLVDRWALRLVGVTYDTILPSGNPGDTDVRAVPRLHVYEVGGELARARWPDGFTWRASLGTLRVQATRRGQPAPGTVVRLLGTGYEGTADASGTIEIDALLPGRYAASIADPRLEALGVPLPTPLAFTAARDSVVQASIEAETAEDFVERRCLAERGVAGQAWVLGRVVTHDGRPAAGARWAIRDRSTGSVFADHGRAYDDGLFQWCRLPLGATVQVDARQGDRRAMAVRPLTDRLTLVLLRLDAR